MTFSSYHPYSYTASGHLVLIEQSVFDKQFVVVDTTFEPVAA